MAVEESQSPKIRGESSESGGSINILAYYPVSIMNVPYNSWRPVTTLPGPHKLVSNVNFSQTSTRQGTEHRSEIAAYEPEENTNFVE